MARRIARDPIMRGMLRRTALATAASVGAAAAYVQTGHFQREQAAQARRLLRRSTVQLASVGAPSAAASALNESGVCVLHGALADNATSDTIASLVSDLESTVGLTTAVGVVGAAAAMMLPTIHTADGWTRAKQGAALAQVP
jgi:hypothetical protein